MRDTVNASSTYYLLSFSVVGILLLPRWALPTETYYLSLCGCSPPFRGVDTPPFCEDRPRVLLRIAEVVDEAGLDLARHRCPRGLRFWGSPCGASPRSRAFDPPP